MVAVVFTGAGDRAFCTGGNTKEYAEYYSQAAQRVRRVHGSVQRHGRRHPQLQETDHLPGQRHADRRRPGDRHGLRYRDLLGPGIFGQAGPKHGSAPDGGSTDFLPWFLSMEDAMWNCISCEMWSAYKMKLKGLITKVAPVLKER